jgi:segregation and condensation protein B
MSQAIQVLPELKEIIGSLLFASKEPVNVQQIRRVLVNTAEEEKGATKDFAKATPADIKQAVELLARDLEKAKLGFVITEVAKGYRLENQTRCGPWLREHLNKSKANRLSRPALETLAIIAYRQPVTRQDIEAVRGVAVDAIVKNLLDLQLIKVIGRSDLPGRPWLFGTTQQFLLHFGIRDIVDLPNIEELKKMKEKKDAEKPAPEKDGESSEEDDEESAEKPAAEKGAPSPAPEDELVGEDDLDEDEDEFDDDEDGEDED